MNVERVKKGLKEVKWDEDLSRAARYHAGDMSNNDYFEHDIHDRVGTKLVRIGGTFERISKFSRRGHSENIAWNQSTPADVMRSWMNSPGHRDNILSPRSTLLGAGYVNRYWVQVFGN